MKWSTLGGGAVVTIYLPVYRIHANNTPPWKDPITTLRDRSAPLDSLQPLPTCGTVHTY